MASAPQPKKKLTPAQYASINRFRNKRIYQMINEFHLIPKCDKAPYTFESYEEFPDLNRYGNIKCVEATRVKLYNTAYVHANYAPYGASSLILSQGPEIQQPFAIKWTIKEADLKALGASHSGALNSKRKRLSPQIQYHLSLFPFGMTKDENRGQTTVVLNLELGRSHKVTAEYSLQIEAIQFCENVSHFFDKSGSRGIVLCLSEDLFDPEKKFFIDGEMILFLKGKVKFTEHPQSEDLVTSNPRNLGKVFYERDDKDFAFIVKGQQIKIHKYILGVQSPVFDRMVQSGLKEAKNNCVEIPNYPFEVVEIIVKLCYDVHVPGHLLYENKVQLFEFADQYQMDSIKEMIETLMIKKLSVINVCSLANCSIIGKAANLQKHCYNLLLKCLKEETIVADLNILNKDLKLKLFEDAFVFVG